MNSSETLGDGIIISSRKKPEEDVGGFTSSSSRAPIRIEAIVAAKVAASKFKRYAIKNNRDHKTLITHYLILYFLMVKRTLIIIIRYIGTVGRKMESKTQFEEKIFFSYQR